jgi:hypothetical protein
MKREILCLACADRIRSVVMKPEPGEDAKFLRGRLRIDCVCDHCITPLQCGDEAEAMSIWSNSYPYVPWESQYIFRLVKGESK